MNSLKSRSVHSAGNAIISTCTPARFTVIALLERTNTNAPWWINETDNVSPLLRMSFGSVIGTRAHFFSAYFRQPGWLGGGIISPLVARTIRLCCSLYCCAALN